MQLSVRKNVLANSDCSANNGQPAPHLLFDIDNCYVDVAS